MICWQVDDRLHPNASPASEGAEFAGREFRLLPQLSFQILLTEIALTSRHRIVWACRELCDCVSVSTTADARLAREPSMLHYALSARTPNIQNATFALHCYQHLLGPFPFSNVPECGIGLFGIGPRSNR